MGTSVLVEYAIFVLWSLICYSIGHTIGRDKRSEEEKENDSDEWLWLVPKFGLCSRNIIF